MTQTREIITFQIGHYSNFVGTHWWNIQEASFCYDDRSDIPLEINHDVLFREGKNPRGEVTYTPRLVAVDLKGSLRTLYQEGTLYDVPHIKGVHASWSGPLDVYRAESLKKNEFLTDLERVEESLYPELEANRNTIDEDKDICQDDPKNNIPGVSGLQSLLTKRFYNLDDSIDVWSDFLKVHLHPRSIFLIEDYFHQNEEEPFDLFGYGVQAYSNEKNQDNIEDRVRKYAEECDALQGFHILLDGSDGFSGVAKCVIQYLEDDYANKVKLCFPLYQARYRNTPKELVKKEEVYRLFNSLMCFDSMVCHSALFSPLSIFSGLLHDEENPVSFPFLNYNAKLKCHTSAILAAALDTITIPTRLRQQPVHMVDMTNNLSCFGRKLAATSICLPFPMQNNSYLSNLRDGADHNIIMQSVTPSCLLAKHRTLTEGIVLRGIPKAKWYSDDIPWQHYPSVEDMFFSCIKQNRYGSVSAVTIVESPCKVNAPFPHIFIPEVNPDGFLEPVCRLADKGVDSVPVAAGLHSNDGAASLLRFMLSEASKINFQKYHHCLETGVEYDDIAEVTQSLHTFLANYTDTYM